MIGRWTRHFIWGPYERACRVLPLIPFKTSVVQLEDGILCLQTGNPISHLLSRIAGGYDYSVVYLVEGELLIDTGFPWARRSLKKSLLALGADESLKLVVNTHYHEDHTGNNDLIKEFGPVLIYAHRDAIHQIRFPSEMAWYRRFLFGPPPASEPLLVPERLHVGRFSFEVLDLPGHCPGHICLWEPKLRWLFSGDLYIAPDLDTQLPDVDGPAWIESLQKAIALAPTLMMDAHGVVVRGEAEVRSLLARKLEFLVELRRRVQAAASGAKPVGTITREVFGSKNSTDLFSRGEGWLSILTASDFSRSNLVKSFLSQMSDYSNR